MIVALFYARRGGEFLVNTTIANVQNAAKVAGLPSGRFIVMDGSQQYRRRYEWERGQRPDDQFDKGLVSDQVTNFTP